MHEILTHYEDKAAIVQRAIVHVLHGSRKCAPRVLSHPHLTSRSRARSLSYPQTRHACGTTSLGRLPEASLLAHTRARGREGQMQDDATTSTPNAHTRTNLVKGGTLRRRAAGAKPYLLAQARQKREARSRARVWIPHRRRTRQRRGCHSSIAPIAEAVAVRVIDSGMLVLLLWVF